MIQAVSVADFKAARAQCDGKVALVPTMGNLHEGHLSLMRLAKTQADQVIATIFVNPLQFSAGEDLESYPRTLDADLELLQNEGVDLVFTPTEQDLYPKGREQQTQVVVPGLSNKFCGASRPNFFGGIATVVTKLLCLTRPDLAVFGQKDFQQFLVIQRLVEDLHLDVALIRAPIVRESDGLAMSSRNGYLSAKERKVAGRLYQELLALKAKLEMGANDVEAILAEARVRLSKYFTVDYLVAQRASDLGELDVDCDLPNQPCVLLAAVMLGRTRLIDNVLVAGT